MDLLIALADLGDKDNGADVRVGWSGLTNMIKKGLKNNGLNMTITVENRKGLEEWMEALLDENHNTQMTEFARLREAGLIATWLNTVA